MVEKGTVRFNRYIKSMNIGVSIENLTGNNMSRSHAHNGYELYFLIDGSRRFLIKNNFYKIEKGDLLLISPGILHKTLDESPSEYKRLVINFPEEILDNVIGKVGVSENFAKKDAIILRDSSVLSTVNEEISFLEDVANNSDNSSGEFEFMSLSVLYRLIYFLTSGKSILPDTKINEKESELISGVLDYINRNYTHSITLNELSVKFYMSEFHLCRSFKKSTGRTIVEYINYLRIEKAKKILSENRKIIKDVAKMCGFKSISHFNHVFKEYENVNPSQFLKSRK